MSDGPAAAEADAGQRGGGGDASADLLPRLNAEQRRAVTHQGGPCLVLAGAGSGKTRVLTYRIAYLIAERGVSPGAICAVTFTNKAAAEMHSRVTELLGGQPPGLWLSTFHALGLRLLREWAGHHGAPQPGFSVYDRDSALAVWRRCQAELRVSPREYDPARLFGRCSNAVNRLEDPGSWDAPERGWEQRLAGRIWKSYRQAMDASGAVDFDDLLVLPLRLLSGHPELLRACQHRFQHLLVDEYQDTNRLQYRLVRTLLGDGEGRELVVVGDEDQSIYRWRGADLNNVLDFQNDFPGATLIRLEQNYRSTQPILSAAGSLVAHNRQRLGKSLWTEQQEGEPPVFRHCATDRQEAEWVAKEVARLGAKEFGQLRPPRASRPTPEESPGAPPEALDEIAILYRTNAQSRLFEEELTARRIPHRVVGGQRFFARREVRDVLAYLALLVRDDEVALRRAVAAPSRGIGPATLDALASHDPQAGAAATLSKLASRSDGEEALRAAGCPGTAIAPLLGFFHLLEGLRQVAVVSTLPELVTATLDRSGYKRALAAGPDGEERLANLEELISAAAEAFADSDAPQETGDQPNEGLARLASFLDRIALLTDPDVAEGQTGGVRLMTIHAAKGLEFNRVFLVGMEEDLFPHATALAEGQLEEERRLCYVGMTRARRRLALSAALSRRIHGRDRWQEPSRFVREIDPRYLIVRDELVASSRPGAAAVPRAAGPSTRRGAVGSAPSARNAVPGDGGLREGARVLHPKFGAGKIISAQGSGDALKLKIRFAKAGTKTILARYANLQLVSG